MANIKRQFHRFLSDKDQLWAERVEKMRQDFVANVSHELRTPLTVILGFVEGMLDSGAPELENWRPILKQIHGQSYRMQSLVNDLLLLSRLETTPLEAKDFYPVDVPSVLKHIIRDAKVLSGERGHVFHLDCEPGIRFNGIENELNSAFSNLIFNAVHYTPAGGQIWVKWFMHANKPCFSVRDTGIGIEPEHIPRITERFYRVDTARSREKGGTGLGLAIVKHVLIRHQGHLDIISEPNQGSEFMCIFDSNENQ